MNWTEFQEKANETAIYPGAGTGDLAYVTLGLHNEIGEFYNTFGAKEKVAELGDVLWYLAELCTQLDVNLTDVMENSNSVDTWGSIWSVTARLAGIAKKAMRDGDLTEKHKRAILLLPQIAGSIKFLAKNSHMELDDSAIYCIQKLADRKARNKLKGDGDHR